MEGESGIIYSMKEFGIKRENEERRDGGCAVIFNPQNGLFAVYRNEKNGILGLYGGGFDEGEDEKDGVLREVKEESGLYDFSYIEKVEQVITHYFNTNKNVNRVAMATCFLFILNSEKREETKLEAHENFSFIWARAEEILSSWEDNNKDKNYEHWVYFFKNSLGRLGELGYLK